MTEEQRRAIRVDSLNLLYVGIFENNEIIKQAIGRTLNVSESGILLEMHFSIDPGRIVSLSLALEEDLVNINGDVVYSRSGDGDKYEIGIKFRGTEDKSLRILKKYIKAFRAQA